MVVSKRPSHANLSITSSFYGHSRPDRQKEAANDAAKPVPRRKLAILRRW